MLPKRPYLRGLALASIWYVAIVTFRFVDGQTGVAGVPLSLALGLVPWLLTAAVLRPIVGGPRIKTRWLVLLGFPIFHFCWALTIIVVYGLVMPLVRSI